MLTKKLSPWLTAKESGSQTCLFFFLGLQWSGFSSETWTCCSGVNPCNPSSPGQHGICPSLAPPMLREPSQPGSALSPDGQDTGSGGKPSSPSTRLPGGPWLLVPIPTQPLPSVPRVESIRPCFAEGPSGVQRHLSPAVPETNDKAAVLLWVATREDMGSPWETRIYQRHGQRRREETKERKQRLNTCFLQAECWEDFSESESLSPV